MMYYLELFPKWNIIIYSKSVEEVFIYNGFNMKRIFIVVLLLLGVNSIFDFISKTKSCSGYTYTV